ncbi:MAG TPA: beta-N-acetylhexosaminidase, partial [Polyangiaceae bacterium]|nr:beta-N-acetylhexosaminidase [Polyangiaceae bacterium]
MSSPTSWSRRAAQLLAVGFAGHTLDADLRDLIDRGVSGVVLFSRNIQSASQVSALVAEIKGYAGRPLYVAVDQEGGVVQRLRDGFTRWPAMRALGATRDTQLAFEVGQVLAAELTAVGIDVNFAPVIDVDTNPDNPVIGDRAFGEDPQLVAEMGVALGKGLEASGVAACGKHFPGHGDTELDSHLALPVVRHGRERLMSTELWPFRAWGQAGLASLMTAHVVFEALESGLPATMSAIILQDLLRGELGYEGLVISDDLEMKAVSEHFGVGPAAVLGLAAGVDQFLVCRHAQVAIEVIEALERA